jgi:hypothetical protein
VTQKAVFGKSEELLSAVGEKYYHSAIVHSPATIAWANKKIPIYAQLDDMAQMIGRKIPVVSDESEKVVSAIKKWNAVLVPGIGILVRAENKDDLTALGLLVTKAAICSIHTAALNVKARIGVFDAALMKLVYKMKYSKQKG